MGWYSRPPDRRGEGRSGGTRQQRPIVSGDSHLLHLKQFMGTGIVTAASAIEKLAGELRA
jgi:hypothetical protein